VPFSRAVGRRPARSLGLQELVLPAAVFLVGDLPGIVQRAQVAERFAELLTAWRPSHCTLGISTLVTLNDAGRSWE
jgi:hypothetical protein